MAEVGAVLVHGLWHGAWAWDGVRARLEAAGVPSAAVELPMTSLEDDVAATVAELDRFGKPAVLVGHSYGGAVVTAAGEHPHVRHLLYLAAFAAGRGRVGEPGTARPGHPAHRPRRSAAVLRRRPAGERRPGARRRACSTPTHPRSPRRPRSPGCGPSTGRCSAACPPRSAGGSRPPPTSCAPTTAPCTPTCSGPWPSARPPGSEWPGGHSPLLTRPAAVADLIATLACSTRTAVPRST